jgi:ketosteroid isomerase-like protein
MAERTAAAAEREVREVMELLDAMRLGELARRFTEDAQGVDEITGRWTRGRPALDAYFAQLEGVVSNVRSQLSDLQAFVWGDVALVTFVLDQTYDMEGQRHRLSAPSSIVLRHEQDAWRIAMVHSVPLPDAE